MESYNNSGDQIPANIGLGENMLEKPSRSLEDVFSVTIFCLLRRLEDVFKGLGRLIIVTPHYDKNRQPFGDLFKFWSCSTLL